MEQLAILLQPYKGLIGTVACVVTVAQFFSGSIICKQIHKNKSTEGISSIPFIGGLVVAVLLFKYGLLLDDTATLVVNAISIVLNSLYTIFYYLYSKNKTSEVLKPISYGTALIAILLAYVNWEDQDLLEYRYGFIITILLLALIGSPLVDLNEIIKKQDASSIPLPITCMGTLVSSLWLLYGIVLLNNFMVVQNILGLALGIIQLLLYFIYPKKVPTTKKGRSTKKVD